MVHGKYGATRTPRTNKDCHAGVPPVRFDNLFVCVTQLIIHLDRAVHYLPDSVRKPSTLVAAR